MNENVRVYFCPRSGKEMGMWLIPKDAEKPADGRLRNKKGSKLQEENIS